MLDIKTLLVAEHRGCKIYIRNFNNTFEYLTYVKGELYTTHMVITPNFWRAFAREKYTSKQLADISKYLVRVAHTTIDYVLDQKKKEE